MKIRILRDFLYQTLINIVLYNTSDLGRLLHRKLLKVPCFIDTGVIITNPSNFTPDTKSAIYHNTYILNYKGKMNIGKNSHLGAMCYVNVQNGLLNIGNYVAIGPGTKIIVYSNHYQNQNFITSSYITRDIVIGNNVFIGANCTLLPGTVIHDHVIVGAGSVVKGVLDENSIYVGTPCRKIKSDWFDKNYDPNIA